jgi:hypothetical protein
MPSRTSGAPSGTSSACDRDAARAIQGVGRIDGYVDGRPRGTSDVTDGHRSLRFAGATGARVVQRQGFAVGGLVAARTVDL